MWHSRNHGYNMQIPAVPHLHPSTHGIHVPQEPTNSGQARPGDFQHIQKGTSQFRGVSWNSISEKWRAQLCHGDEVNHLELH
jgi:hypothetical protein